MLINERENKVLKLKHINSLVSLQRWIKKNINIYGTDYRVPNNHMKIYLNYIKEIAKEQRVKPKKDWFDKIDMLIERLEGKA